MMLNELKQAEESLAYRLSRNQQSLNSDKDCMENMIKRQQT